MPIPKLSKGQDEKEFISACIREIIDEYDAPGQAYAVCKGEYDKENMSEEFADYAWDDCMIDQIERYGDEETAAKICGSIKAANMSSEDFATLPTVDCMEEHKSAGYTEQYAKWACSGRKSNDGQQGGVVGAMSEQFGRKKFEYPASYKETMTGFMSRCMSDIAVKEEKKNRADRAGFCYSQYQNRYLSNIGKKWK